VNCFNGQKYLKQALQSVLEQTYKNWELIFWDNLSTDNSKKVFLEFSDYRFKYFVSDQHTTLYAARNKAIKQSKGEIIAFLDTDDWWDKNKLEKQINHFQDQEVGLVHSNFYLFYENNKKKKIWHKKNIKSGYITENLCKNYNIGIVSTLISKKAYISALGFNNSYNVIGDFDLFMRLSQKWKFIYVAEKLAFARIHNENFSLLNSDMEVNELEKWIHDAQNKTNEILDPYLHYVIRRLNFVKTKKYINDGNFTKAIKNIILLPMGFNKIKLILRIFLPKVIVKRVQYYQ